MDVAPLIDRLETDGRLLIVAAGRAGWVAPVPRLDWTVRELVLHTGGIHRWAADIVTTCSDTPETAAAEAVGAGPDDDDELAAWFAQGHAALVATLRSAPGDLECFSFLPADSALHFWARRQAHETAMHRVDAEGAAGGPLTPFEAQFAQDGIGEIVHGFAARRKDTGDRTTTLGLAATDGPSWVITFGDERIVATECDELSGTDATVRGTSSDIYQWLWNRPSEAVVDGEAGIAELWSNAVQVRWS
jgi:uncharacterized protein (TIGR03083 family)